MTASLKVTAPTCNRQAAIPQATTVVPRVETQSMKNREIRLIASKRIVSRRWHSVWACISSARARLRLNILSMVNPCRLSRNWALKRPDEAQYCSLTIRNLRRITISEPGIRGRLRSKTTAVIQSTVAM